MRKRKISDDRTIVGALVLLLLAGPRPEMASAGQSDEPRRGVAVYVTDFELSVARPPSPDPPKPSDTDRLEEGLQLQSRQLQEKFAETLVDTLRHKGYSSSRNQVLPGNGILLKGVFAQSDQKNRIRQALLGSKSPASKLTLYVGAFDVKRASQPLYVEAPVQEPDPNYGPVITLNSYIPMAKYEVEKEITEEDVRRICGQIVVDLTTLLQRNPATLAQKKGTLLHHRTNETVVVGRKTINAFDLGVPDDHRIRVAPTSSDYSVCQVPLSAPMPVFFHVQKDS